jgi:hypothetical protein
MSRRDLCAAAPKTVFVVATTFVLIVKSISVSGASFDVFIGDRCLGIRARRHRVGAVSRGAPSKGA